MQRRGGVSASLARVRVAAIAAAKVRASNKLSRPITAQPKQQIFCDNSAKSDFETAGSAPIGDSGLTESRERPASGW
jgi:hypothetical protein